MCCLFLLTGRWGGGGGGGEQQFPVTKEYLSGGDFTTFRHRLAFFSVSAVTPWKIKMQTLQHRKSRIREIKEDKYTKSLAKNQVCTIFQMRDIRKKVLPKFIKLCMETPFWCPWIWPPETNSFQVFLLMVEFFAWGTHKYSNKVIVILKQGMFR